MAYRRSKNKLPRRQKPMVKAGPESNPLAANALSSHIKTLSKLERPSKTRRTTSRTHDRLGNEKVIKRKSTTKAAKKQPVIDPSQLNTSLKPAGVVHRRGKKGKIFADDRESMAKVLSVVNARMDQVHATKIERAKQLEEVREAKRKEIELREQAKADRIDQKKRDIKKKRRGKNNDFAADEGKSQRKGKVSFAV
ncbi:hypothetical protein V1514DRAFT_330068 [Lipomyces japonicus]|uniref:uncharacterized protein n=1 Tax=Lipomyces japonicus TaxID=56871 RepID=UPI0034CF6F35